MRRTSKLLVGATILALVGERVRRDPRRREETNTYASHGLRFDVRRPLESTDEFRKRINKKALAEEERRPSGQSDASEWFFGPEQRVSGSLHTDIWEGTAADLAHRGASAVFPVTGWCKGAQGSRSQRSRGPLRPRCIDRNSGAGCGHLDTRSRQEIGMAIEIET
jgi:hypothetical protein